MHEIHTTTTRVRLSEIAEKTCQAFDIAPQAFYSKCRKSLLVNARSVFCQVANRLDYTNTDIGNHLGKDRTTVFGLLKDYAHRLRNFPEYQHQMTAVTRHFLVQTQNIILKSEFQDAIGKRFISSWGGAIANVEVTDLHGGKPLQLQVKIFKDSILDDLLPGILEECTERRFSPKDIIFKSVE